MTSTSRSLNQLIAEIEEAARIPTRQELQATKEYARSPNAVVKARIWWGCQVEEFLDEEDYDARAAFENATDPRLVKPFVVNELADAGCGHVKVLSIQFMEFDSANISHAGASYVVVLEGPRKEIEAYADANDIEVEWLDKFSKQQARNAKRRDVTVVKRATETITKQVNDVIANLTQTMRGCQVGSPDITYRADYARIRVSFDVKLPVASTNESLIAEIDSLE